MSQTWINCFITLIIPSEEALSIVKKCNPKQKVPDNLAEIEKFLAQSLGQNFHEKFQLFTDPKS